MEASTKLQYVTGLNAGGSNHSCVESYDSILERMREADFKFSAAESADDGAMQWAGPIELTVQGPEGIPLRAAFALHSISFFYELPEEHRTDVQVDE